VPISIFAENILSYTLFTVDSRRRQAAPGAVRQAAGQPVTGSLGVTSDKNTTTTTKNNHHCCYHCIIYIYIYIILLSRSLSLSLSPCIYIYIYIKRIFRKHTHIHIYIHIYIYIYIHNIHMFCLISKAFLVRDEFSCVVLWRPEAFDRRPHKNLRRGAARSATHQCVLFAFGCLFAFVEQQVASQIS